MSLAKVGRLVDQVASAAEAGTLTKASFRKAWDQATKLAAGDPRAGDMLSGMMLFAQGADWVPEHDEEAPPVGGRAPHRPPTGEGKSRSAHLAEMIRFGMRFVEGEPGPLEERCWGIVTKHASAGPRLHSPRVGERAAPKLAAKLRREILLFVLDAPAKDAIEALEAFDFEYPRGWSGIADDDEPYSGGPSRDNEARMAPTRAAWQLCRAAKDAHPDELERLRGGVRETLAGWPEEVIAWYVAQVDAVAEATRHPG